jgi:HEAT repeat protein
MLVLPRSLLVLIASGLLLIEQQPSRNSEMPQINPQESSPKKEPVTSSETSAPKQGPETIRTLEQQAWSILEAGAKSEKIGDRAAAIHVLGLLPNDRRARKMAEAALGDNAAEVRSASAAALGEMRSRNSIPKLKSATDDKDPSVALAAAHALLQLKDNSGYDLYYEVLTGERKTGKSVLAQAAVLKDPKKLAEIGFQQGLGFIPFAGMGWKVFKTIKKGDSSPARAAAATVLSKDPDPRTTEALANAAGDKNWIIREAALEALSRRGDPSALNTVGLYLSDQEGEVKYTAAATALRLAAIRQSRPSKQK